MPRPNEKTVQEIRDLLDGPVNSIPTAFTESGELDAEGTRSIIESGIEGGCSVSLLTYGDSQIEFLSDDEVLELTKLTVAQSAGRTLTVAANRRWAQDKTVEFARFCREAGVDMLMLTVGENALGSEDQALAGMYLAVAQVIPVMIVGEPRHSLLDQLADEPRVCSFKEDGAVEYAVATMRRYGDRWKFMTGGGLWRNFTQWPFGCRAFMSPWCNIKPEVNQRYHEAMLGNDLDAAGEVITRLDWPLFDLAAKYTGGWQTVWRAILEIQGTALRYRRAPMPSATEADLEAIEDDLRRLGVLS